MAIDRSFVRAKLSNGQEILIASSDKPKAGERTTVAQSSLPFPKIGDGIAGIAKDILNGLKQLPEPSSVTVSFAVAVSAETGQLLKIVAKGSASATLTVEVGWAKAAG